jgi:hypothetical protein
MFLEIILFESKQVIIKKYKYTSNPFKRRK